MDSTLTLRHVYTAMCIHEPDYCGLGVLGFEVRQLHDVVEGCLDASIP